LSGVHVLSLANKLAPSIIFIDEIDCFMRTRNVMEQDHVVRVKTEFMTLWDGLLTGTYSHGGTLGVFCSERELN